MKIVGKIKRDFYDSGAQYGQDPNLLLIRNPEEIEYSYGGNPATTGLEKYYLNMNPILFCGKAYPRLICSRNEIDEFVPAHQDPKYVIHIYTLDGLNKIMETNKDIARTMKDRMYGSRWDLNKTYYDYWRDIFEKGPYTVSDELFIKHKAPYMRFVKNRGSYQKWEPTVTVHTFPVLSEYEFNRVMPANQAWQEIEMYLSNVLVSERYPPVQIKDIDKIAKHGFDEKSFRKEKQS